MIYLSGQHCHEISKRFRGLISLKSCFLNNSFGVIEYPPTHSFWRGKGRADERRAKFLDV
jgi:hypothetical protein